jgi:hypothetical protein
VTSPGVPTANSVTAPFATFPVRPRTAPAETVPFDTHMLVVSDSEYFRMLPALSSAM